MYQPLCLCPEIPILQLQTRIAVLMHCREKKLTTNTAGLACLALPNSQIYVRGEKNSRLDTREIISAVGQTVLLYPSDDAVELSSDLFQGPITLIVPDGSWRQARKVAMRETALQGLLRVQLPEGAPSDYRLRHSPHPERLSTFEAISRAIGILEGPEHQALLDQLFLKKVERTMWSRGLLKPEKCVTQIPEAAFLASRIAGLRK
jgi:DTW domain-containing protein YfiP